MVIYNSQTGFTKRYAQWTAEAAGAECLTLPEMKRGNVDPYNAIIFGGWACAGGFNYEKMSAPSKIMIKMFVKTLQAKKDKTESEREMIKMISSSYDISDRKYIKPILECLEK